MLGHFSSMSSTETRTLLQEKKIKFSSGNRHPNSRQLERGNKLTRFIQILQNCFAPDSERTTGIHLL